MAADRLQALGLTVGTVVSVEDHPGARAPSYRLTIDFGRNGRRQSTIPAPHYAREDLLDRQVICVTAEDEITVLTAHSHSRGLVLIEPAGKVENGSPVA